MQLKRPLCAACQLPTAVRMPAVVQDPVEDTKGNNGDGGRLSLTNLRLMWTSKKQHRTNISVGLNTITSIAVRAATSRLKGAHAAYMLETVLTGAPPRPETYRWQAGPWHHYQRSARAVLCTSVA